MKLQKTKMHMRGRVVIICTSAFVLAASIIALSAFLDFPAVVADALPTSEKWLHPALDAFFVLIVGAFAIYLLSRLVIEKTKMKEELELKAQLLDAATDSIFVYRPDGSFVYMNEVAYESRGYNREQLMATNSRALDAPGFAESYDSRVKEIMDTGETIFECLHFRRDGTAMPVEAHARLITMGGEDLILSVCRDITEHKQAEQLLMTLANSSPIGLYIVQDGEFQYINPRFQQLMGYGNELLGRPALSFVFAEDREMVRENAVKMLKNQRFSPYEYRYVNKQGETRWVLERVVSIHYQGKRATLGSFMDITERKQVEEALRKSEVRYKTIFESAREGIIVFGPDGRIVSTNQAAAVILGYDSPEEMVGIFGAELWLDQEQRDAIQAELVEKGYVEDKERIFRKKDGTPIYALGSGILHRDTEGNILQVESIFTDITQRKQAEKERLELETRYTTVVEQAIDGIVIIQDDVVKFANKSVMDMMGYTPEETIGKPPLDSIITEEQERVGQRLAERRVGHQFSDVLTLQIRHKDGTFRHLESSGTVIQYEGHPALLVFTRDVTKRQKAEEALKQSEEKYRSLVTRIPDITWTNTIKGEIVFISANVETVLGYSTESLHAKGLRALLENIHPDDLNNYRQAFTALFEKNKPLDIEYRIRRIDGNWVWLRSRSGAIYEKDGVLCVDGLTSDITQHKEMAKEIHRKEREVAAAREMERLKSDLLSTVSHELRTPLASIKGYATMLLEYERRLKRDEKRSYLESIDRATNRLTELIDHLLDMSRLDAGLLRMARASTDINKLLDEAVSEAQMRSPEHQLRAEIKKELPTLNVDDRRIRQVVDNLLDNAIKYSQKGTEVVVRAAVRAQEVEISVTDQGRGIPASELGKVFDRMYRIEQRLAKDPGGLGLGLALCKALVEAHGGRIWLESEVEKGSIFFFTLPLGSKE